MREIMSGPPQSLLTLAIVGAIWTASSTIEGLRTILNIAYGVSAPPAYIWRRLLSIVQLLAIAITIMVITFLLIFIPLVGDSLQYSFIFNAMNSDIVQFISKSAIFMVLFIIVCTIYYVLPNTQLKLRKVVPGAILVVLLWFLSASLLSSYLNHFQQLSLIYGSLGGMIISLLFFYIINLILIYGAEFNHLLDKK
jgi:membrane protein